MLDKQALLDAQTFWDNRDWDWYKRNIPFLDTPDADINATYYYRWELLTKHLVYGSPANGYSFTEFIDRPFWSGRYGAISCPAGHQLYESRWLKDTRIAQDYARYWTNTPGAQPRRYSTWLADATWATYLVQSDHDWIVSMREGLIENYRGWEKDRFVPKVGLFWQTGHDDGMEYNINSRQTADLVRGAPGFRPTLNAYLYADAVAIHRISLLAGDAETARIYGEKAAALKAKVQAQLWDKRRGFFLHRFQKDETDGISAEGHKRPIQAGTFTYDSGPFEGNSHGRELIGYVPWQFNLPDADKGYESAWKLLNDRDGFAAPFGPTVAERHDPLFLITKSCCYWSGQSWPYATSQTLTALANLLNNYNQQVVSRDDYFHLLKTYTLTQRQNNRPYIAEGANPDTGSWEGYDSPGHSDHYFHSSYNDLIISGLVGLRPRADDILEVNPLAPRAWKYFALDDVLYHGHRVSIVWDAEGTHYNRGRGLMLFINGRRVAHAWQLQRLTAKMPRPTPSKYFVFPWQERPINFAVNNDGTRFPHLTASFFNPLTPLRKIIDGNYWYHQQPANRWTSEGSANARDWLELDFGIVRRIHTIKLYLLDDGANQKVRAPARLDLEWWDGAHWQPIPNGRRNTLEGHKPTVFDFAPLQTSKLRATLTHRENAASGLTEWEAWGEAPLPIAQPDMPSGNIAFNDGKIRRAVATASYTFKQDRAADINDGLVSYVDEPRNRWTAFDSPNASDWIELDFSAAKTVRNVVVYLFADRDDIRIPQSVAIQTWNGIAWTDATIEAREPNLLQAGAPNSFRIAPIQTDKIRIVFTHAKGFFSGATEIQVFET